MIEVNGLRKSFGATLALDGMSFTVMPGQVTGFVGPNGAGKSTTMRVILGWLIAGRVLRPLRTMTVATQRISADRLHERLAMPGPRDELTDLADTIDGLLERLEGAFAAPPGVPIGVRGELLLRDVIQKPHDIHRLVIADQNVHFSSGMPGLPLQLHQQIHAFS